MGQAGMACWRVIPYDTHRRVHEQGLSDPMASSETYQPAQWLRELSRLQPAKWSWGQAIRAGLAICLPMAGGLALGQFDTGLLIGLGALGMALGEGDGSYRSRFRQMAISASIGALGFLAGYLSVLPYPLVIMAMAALAFLAGIVNSYGAAYSIGTMLALVYASIAIGLPAFGPDYWKPAVLSLVGAGVHASLLGVVVLIERTRPEREMLAGLAGALAQLAAARAAPDADAEAVSAARRAVTERSRAIYGDLIAVRGGGRTHETVAHADFLNAADALFSAIMNSTEPATLRAASAWLQTVADAIGGHGAIPALPREIAPEPQARDRLSQALADFAAAAVSDAVGAKAGHGHGLRPRTRLGELSLPSLVVGRVVLRRAAILALCIGLGFAARYIVAEDHWFWVPMTVALVMKPELGSVFVRAVLRAAGTALGVILGIGILLSLHKGYALVMVLGLLGAVLPWAKRVSYGVQTLVLTPLVLILLSLVTPDVGTFQLSDERLINTLLGAAIAVCFGYLIWPRAQGGELARQFEAALAAVADYLVAATSAGAAEGRIGAARRAAYASLSDLRATLNRSMAEPPPAGREAAAWFPLVAASERICDRITAEAPLPGSTQRPPAPEVLQVADQLRAVIAGDGRERAASAVSEAPTDPFLQAIAGEVALLAGRVDSTVEPRPSPPARRGEAGGTRTGRRPGEAAL